MQMHFHLRRWALRHAVPPLVQDADDGAPGRLLPTVRAADQGQRRPEVAVAGHPRQDRGTRGQRCHDQLRREV